RVGECRIDSMPPLANVRYIEAQRSDTHCIVRGVIEREIHFQVTLPDDWNGMFAQSGGGGFVGSVVDVIHLATRDKRYATAGTDSGQKKQTPSLEPPKPSLCHLHFDKRHQANHRLHHRQQY
ncbi:tannase/feruloyl esterase family alpha/beta hydrolase, partial [Vibrio vulnificus]|uniref:tannase/feruloyl esterase family alpha/beta hydrolase n=1 Tax=Vibrio vulnificus TaxID=672 RepID=UPI0024DFDC7B